MYVLLINSVLSTHRYAKTKKKEKKNEELDKALR